MKNIPEVNVKLTEDEIKEIGLTTDEEIKAFEEYAENIVKLVKILEEVLKELEEEELDEIGENQTARETTGQADNNKNEQTGEMESEEADDKEDESKVKAQ